MSISPHSRRLTTLMALAAVAATHVPSSAVAKQPDKRATAAKKAKKLTKRQRQKLRRELRREAARHPTAVFKPSFMKKASLVDFKLPLTVRVGPAPGQPPTTTNQLEIDWGQSANPWPSGFTTPAPQTVALTGTFTMEADFGGDASGYGELGAVETIAGGQANLTATPVDPAQPTEVAGPNASCNPGDPDQVVVDPGTPLTFSSGGVRYGLLNMFSQTIRGSLLLSTSVPADVSVSCGPLVPAGLKPAPGPAMPLEYNGKFYVSPALTSDGKMRLGKMIITSPQTSTAAQFAACTVPTSVAADCSPMQFPARIQVTQMTAEVLLGDIRSS
jgi:hypothetical protein